jgi:hypothetical protein
LENLDDDVDIKKAWTTISNNIKISARESRGCYELKQHTPWIYEVCLKLLEQITFRYAYLYISFLSPIPLILRKLLFF